MAKEQDHQRLRYHQIWLNSWDEKQHQRLYAHGEFLSTDPFLSSSHLVILQIVVLCQVALEWEIPSRC